MVAHASPRKARRKNLGGGSSTQGSVAPTQNVTQLPTEPGTSGLQPAEQEAARAAAVDEVRPLMSQWQMFPLPYDS